MSMAKDMKQIAEYIKEHGKKGVEKCEKLICLQHPIGSIIPVEVGTVHARKKRVKAHSVSYFADTNDVQIYCLDDNNEGWFIGWNKASATLRKKIQLNLKLSNEYGKVH